MSPAFRILGTPLPSLGHSRYCSIAMTTGGPDTSDVFEEELNPDNPRQYRYDGQWRDSHRAQGQNRREERGQNGLERAGIGIQPSRPDRGAQERQSLRHGHPLHG